MAQLPDPSEPITPEPDGALFGVRCGRCRRVAAPAQRFGCERCGAAEADLEEVVLSGRGRVLAAVTVHEHPDPAVPTPAVIASIALEEGPVLRALLHGDAPGQGWPGQEVDAVPDEGSRVAFRAAGSPA